MFECITCFYCCFNFQRLSSKEDLTIRTRHVYFICPLLSPILRHLEELLLCSVTLQGCRIHGTRRGFLPRPCSTSSYRKQLFPSSLKTSLKRRQTERPRIACCLISSRFYKHLHNSEFISPRHMTLFSYSRFLDFFSLTRVVPCFPLLGLTPSGLFMGLSSTIIYTSELILCSTICVPSATRHNIHMYSYFLFAAIYHLKSSPTFSVRPCSSVGRVTEDPIRRSWVRFPPRSKDFFFASCGSLFPFTRANAQWVIHGFK